MLPDAPTKGVDCFENVILSVLRLIIKVVWTNAPLTVIQSFVHISQYHNFYNFDQWCHGQDIIA